MHLILIKNLRLDQTIGWLHWLVRRLKMSYVGSLRAS